MEETECIDVAAKECSFDIAKESQSRSLEDDKLGGSIQKHTEKEVAMDGLNFKEICPYVCGICSDKFDKVSAFYAHLKTHEHFDVISQMNKKNKMLEALNVKDKVNENVFKCGICQVAFPSMSLLHEHMVVEENIPDYNYSNVEHTARPDSTATKAKSVQDKKAKIRASVTNSPNLSRNKRQRKVNETLTSESPTNIKPLEVDSSAEGDTNKKRMTKKRISENQEQEDESASIKERDSTNVTRSSRRVTARGSQKRVDYKALAGFGSPKLSSDKDKKSLRKSNNITSNKRKKMSDDDDDDDDVDRKKPLKSIKNVSMKSKVDTNLTEDMDKDTEVNIVHSECKVISNDYIKVVSMKIVENKKSTEDSINDSVRNEENGQEADGDSETLENDAASRNSKKNTDEIENEWRKGSANKELAIKSDGTFIDFNSGLNSIEANSDYADNASAEDSDDDFKDEEVYPNDDDDVNDPNFMLDLETQDNARNVIESLIDAKKPEDYLKKFKIKKKQTTKMRNGGQLLKNCLYPCAICGRYYVWKALEKHIYAHVKVKLVECTQCGKKYKSKRHLKDHVRSVHAMKKFSCPKCSSILKGNQSFEKHILMHILKKEITQALDEVEKKEVSEEEYIRWKAQQELSMSESSSKKKKDKKEVKEPKTPSREDDIDRSVDIGLLENAPMYGEHIAIKADIVGPTRNLYCIICQRSFPTHECLVQHFLEHNDAQKYSCSICKGFFQTQEHLESHVTSVHGERDLECDVCGEKLRNSYALWIHKGKHLMKKDEYYSEEVVQKLQEEIALRNARKKSMSSKDRLTKCEICGMVVLAVRYKRHLEVHTSTKEWECEICHNFYKTRRYLIDHQKKTHKAEKIPCDICGVKFKGKTYLEIHKQTHGPKDKVCTICGKGFTTLAYLKTHQQTHEEKKKFRCDQCMAGFSHKQRLVIHKVEVHGEGARRPCKYCGDLFPSRQKARRHERIVHEGFTMPTKLKKKPTYYDVVNIDDTDNESLEKKLVRLMPPGQNYVTVSPGVIKVPISKNDTTQAVNDAVSTTAEVESDMDGSGQLIKLGNGNEYQVMVENDGGTESLEFVELTEDEQNVIIQEADKMITHADPLIGEDDSENVEQILEIPENAEQCQILLYPDGTFKLLNVVDKTNLH